MDVDAEIAAMYMDRLHSIQNGEIVDDLNVKPLGSGSDYTVFLQYHGVSEWILK